MKFSTRTTYGLRAMIILGQNFGKKEKVSLATIAEQEKISVKYLEQIFSLLKKVSLVESERGVLGGYYLQKDPQEIDIFEIVQALEGEMSPFHCLSESGKITCSSKCNCGATSVLVKVQKAINDTLRGIMLSELL